MDLFEKLEERPSPLGLFTSEGYGYITFPKLEGPLGPEMTFNGKSVIVWSINDYLGLEVMNIFVKLTQKLQQNIL